MFIIRKKKNDAWLLIWLMIAILFFIISLSDLKSVMKFSRSTLKFPVAWNNFAPGFSPRRNYWWGLGTNELVPSNMILVTKTCSFYLSCLETSLGKQIQSDEVLHQNWKDAGLVSGTKPLRSFFWPSGRKSFSKTQWLK